MIIFVLWWFFKQFDENISYQSTIACQELKVTFYCRFNCLWCFLSTDRRVFIFSDFYTNVNLNRYEKTPRQYGPFVCCLRFPMYLVCCWGLPYTYLHRLAAFSITLCFATNTVYIYNYIIATWVILYISLSV